MPERIASRTKRELDKERRREGNRAVFALERYAPYVVKRAFVEGNYQAAMEKLSEAILGGEPWALRCWLEAAGAVGAMQQVIVNMHTSLGVRDESELRELVDSGRKLQALQRDADASLESYWSDATQLIRLCMRTNPEWLDRLRSIVNEFSTAEVVKDE